MWRSAAPERGARLPRGRLRTNRAPQLTWCVQRLVGSPACSTSSAVDEPNRLLCAERGDHPVRSARYRSREQLPRRRRRGASPAGRCRRPVRLPHLRRARRPARDRGCAGRGRHRAHVRHPGADAAARAGRRRRHRPGPHRHGQDARLRRPAAAAGRAARRAARRDRRRRGRDRTRDVPQALVVVPTRELCVQVAEGPGRRRPPSSASGSPRSTAAAPTSRSSPPCARASTWWSAPRAACSTSPSSATSSSAASRRSCSTRPTRCWTSASCPTSSASCGCCPSSGRRCCSRPPCPARSSRCPGRS